MEKPNSIYENKHSLYFGMCKWDDRKLSHRILKNSKTVEPILWAVRAIRFNATFIDSGGQQRQFHHSKVSAKDLCRTSVVPRNKQDCFIFI
jgi:hypothetical protein